MVSAPFQFFYHMRIKFEFESNLTWPLKQCKSVCLDWSETRMRAQDFEHSGKSAMRYSAVDNSPSPAPALSAPSWRAAAASWWSGSSSWFGIRKSPHSSEWTCSCGDSLGAWSTQTPGTCRSISRVALMITFWFPSVATSPTKISDKSTRGAFIKCGFRTPIHFKTGPLQEYGSPYLLRAEQPGTFATFAARTSRTPRTDGWL